MSDSIPNTAQPDPQLVREMAREAAKTSIEDTDFMGIAEQFCDDDRWPADEDAADALHRAIADDLRGAVPTWPDEQARSEHDGDVRRGVAALLDAVETFRAWLTDAYDPDAPAPDPATVMYQRAAELRARIAALAELDARTTDGGAA